MEGWTRRISIKNQSYTLQVEQQKVGFLVCLFHDGVLIRSAHIDEHIAVGDVETVMKRLSALSK